MESQVNYYQLKQGNLLYVFSTSIVNNLIRLSCKNSYGKKFSRDFSLYEINSIDPMFSQINSEQEAINFIDKSLNVHKVGIREEIGEVKIIFYVANKGLLNSVEIPLGEDGKSIVGSYEANQQTYENTNYLYGGDNTYDQNIGISTTDYSGQNFENLGSYNFQDNNQYTQTNYDTYGTTNSYENYGMTSFGNDYNSNSYQYSYNQYSTTTDNNYISSGYDNTYEANGETTFDLNILSNTNNYEPVTNNELYSKPIITPADPIETDNEDKAKSQFETRTSPVNNSNMAENPEKNENQDENQTLNKNNSAQMLTTSQKESTQVKATLNESEIERLKNDAAEAKDLRAQLAELTPLRQQFEQMSVLKGQLDELNSLREKAAELNSLKSQLNELNELREQVNKMNSLKNQLEEIEILRQKAESAENLQKRIEELEKSNLEYQQEIRELKASQMNTPTKVKSPFKAESKGLESKEIKFEEKQICVKGDIIQDTSELELITRKINRYNKKLTLNLLYKASADSDQASSFHEKCDQAKSTIVLVETDKGKRFGGFTTCSWSGDCVDKKDEDAFIFSLDKMKTYDNIPGDDAIGCYPKFGPIFLGCQIRIYDNAFKRGGTTFEKGLNFDTEEDFELTGGERIFNVKEIEVYEVIPQ